MNKKVAFLFIGDSKGQKYFTMKKIHTKISNGKFFPNYGRLYTYVWYGMDMYRLYMLDRCGCLGVYICLAYNCTYTYK